MSEPPRRDPRIAAKRGLLVRCESWSEFVQYYASDISQGGMFIVTDETPELLSEIDVRMSLPEGHDVQLRAQVVHVIDQATAQRDMRPAGIGVQFVELDAVRKAQIHQLVEFARWEGTTEGSVATLAMRMFESAASLPPSKVMQGLPPEPKVPRAPQTPRREGSVAAQLPTAPKNREGSVATQLPTAPKNREGSVAAQLPTAPKNREGSVATTLPTGPDAASTPPKPRASKAPATKTDRPGQTRSSAAPAEPAEGAADPSTSQAPSPTKITGKPLDTDKLKMGMTHLAHRRFLDAIKVFDECAQESPQDMQPVMWRALARARLKLKDNDSAGAAEHYKQVLLIDENNHEARKFVREHGQKKRLEAIPFGRFFVKK